MTKYIWLFILGGIAMIALIFFLMTFSKDMFLIKKLKKTKKNLILNFSLIITTLTCLGLVIYLFTLLKEQINLLQ